MVQKVPDERWMREISGIYASYEMYRQADGAEQSVLDPKTNRFELRSDLIIRYLDSRLGYDDGARLLDVGCGTGVTLEALARSSRRLRLFGLEFDERNLRRLERIRGFEKLFLGELRDIPVDFDLVTLVHALEHFPNPAAALRDSAGRMTAHGALFVQVVDSPKNPFDLVIADHMGHFSANTLRALAQKTGLEIVGLEPNLVRRELAMICKRATGSGASAVPLSADEGLRFATRNLAWLASVLQESGQAASEHSAFGLFGSSIAATWLADALGDRVKFFVDEDPARIGRRHLNRPIVAPQNVPAGAGVYVGMAPVSAEAVVNRFTKARFELIPPPRIDLQ